MDAFTTRQTLGGRRDLSGEGLHQLAAQGVSLLIEQIEKHTPDLDVLAAAIERYFASPASMQPALLILIDGLRPVDMPMPPSVAGMCRNCRRFSSTAATRGMPHAACRVPRAACVASAQPACPDSATRFIASIHADRCRKVLIAMI